jgi:hypothetical protein
MVRYTRQRLRFSQPLIPSLRPSHRASTIERCPSCGRAFTNGTAVLKHLNHPKSSCSHAWIQVPPPQDTDQTSPQPNESWAPDPDWIDYESPMNMDSSTNDCAPGPFCELFPGASATYGQGETFLDYFDQDEHAPKRRKNLYYPFASEAEWEFAAFLHHSGLSTRAINSFFSLQIVSFLLSS